MFTSTHIGGKLRPTIEERFLSKVQYTEGCWRWIGSKDRKGYGVFHINYKNYRASRIMYLLHYGEEPFGFLVLHKCDNPSCVRPDHLYLGDCKDNVRDMIERNRTNNHLGENHAGAKLTRQDVLEIRAQRGISTQRQLADRFGIVQTYVSDLQARKTWKHI